MAGAALIAVTAAALAASPAGGSAARGVAAFGVRMAQDTPPDTASPGDEGEADDEGQPAVPIWEDLPAWRSPVAGPRLTAGEYLLLRPRTRIPLRLSGHPAELVVVPFESTSGRAVYSVAVLRPSAGGDYAAQVLLNGFEAELEDVRLLPGGGAPRVLVAETGGSGGFLRLHLCGWDGSRFRALWAAEGVYQGRWRLRSARPLRLRLVRALFSGVNAFPRGEIREEYAWRGGEFVCVRRRARLRVPFASRRDNVNGPLDAG